MSLAEGLSLSGGAWYASWDAGGADDELDLYIGLAQDSWFFRL